MADWFNEQILENSKFYDNDTSKELEPIMAGANVRSLNALLDPYGIAFGDQRVWSGDFIFDRK